MRRLYALCVGIALCLAGIAPATAHQLRLAYLQLDEAADAADHFEVLWKLPARGEDRRLALAVQLPSHCQPVSEPRVDLVGATMSERWRVHCPGGLDQGRIRVDGMSATGADALVRIAYRDGGEQVARLVAETPEFTVTPAPGALEVAATYLQLGVEHILLGIDHLLFVLALLLIVTGNRTLILTITAFTLAHSITLAAATLGAITVPIPPVEAVIALSIVFVANEILRQQRGRTSFTARAPALVAFVFGLLHGFGFASALSEVGLPQARIPLALLFFNVGVEVGQLLFVAAVLGIRAALRPRTAAAPPWLLRVPPYAIGSVAMFWVIQRIAAF